MRTTITVILTALFITGIHISTMPGVPTPSGITTHLLFHFTHCNIFHLLCNLICLWSIKGKLHLPQAYIIATLSSVSIATLASLATVPSGFPLGQGTQGFSAILLAIIGYKWGLWFNKPITKDQRINATKRICLYILLPILICAFIPNVNTPLHLLSFTLAFFVAPAFQRLSGHISNLWSIQENKQ